MARIVNGGRVTIHDVQRWNTNVGGSTDTTNTLSRQVDLNQAYLITMSGDGTRIGSGNAHGNRSPFTLQDANTIKRYYGNPYGGTAHTVAATAEVVEYFS